MMVVDQGAVAEFCAKPGEFVWDSSAEPTIFYGGLEQGLAKAGRR
jgi:membrane protease subunit (stomatin/prohibitin family)